MRLSVGGRGKLIGNVETKRNREREHAVVRIGDGGDVYGVVFAAP